MQKLGLETWRLTYVIEIRIVFIYLQFFTIVLFMYFCLFHKNNCKVIVCLIFTPIAFTTFYNFCTYNFLILHAVKMIINFVCTSHKFFNINDGKHNFSFVYFRIVLMKFNQELVKMIFIIMIQAILFSVYHFWYKYQD